MNREKHHIILLVNNAKCHYCDNINNLSNVKVHFLPSNTTSYIQPLDQGIIYSLKVKAEILPDDESDTSDGDNSEVEDDTEGQLQSLINELPITDPLSIKEYINIDDEILTEEELLSFIRVCQKSRDYAQLET
ncbi:unnamed protein product [Rhizophagus irregularis]|nr:unnamed protein product [Rhizophagus irregularis]